MKHSVQKKKTSPVIEAAVKNATLLQKAWKIAGKDVDAFVKQQISFERELERDLAKK